ncbi:MAG TPA: OmpA family protein [Tepidisphaeraceae bacterium]|nr:OmpA family protein [Tepidisphaeraceae bacterium]
MNGSWKVLAVAAMMSLAGVGCQSKMYQENQALARQNKELQQKLDDSSHEAALPPQQTPIGSNLTAPTQTPVKPEPVVSTTPTNPDASQAPKPDLGKLDVSRDPIAHTTTVNLPSDVFFSPGQATLLPDAKKSLSKVISALKKEYASKSVRIDGHTDSDPIVKSHWKSNQELSEKRAQAVKDYLVSRGIDGDRITIKGYGDKKPKSKTNKKLNRRVELVVLQTR